MSELKVKILIGVPCSGKSTYRNKDENKDYFVVSRDDIREKLISEYGVSYQDLYRKPKEEDPERHPVYGFKDNNGEWSRIAELNKKLVEEFRVQLIKSTKAIMDGKGVIVDLTNLTKNERKEYIDIYRKLGVKKIEAISFEFKGNESNILKMNEIRGNKTGNVIPEFVIKGMMDKYEEPVIEEGFSEIRNINTYEDFTPPASNISERHKSKNLKNKI